MNSRSGSTGHVLNIDSLKKQVEQDLAREFSKKSQSHEYNQFRKDNIPLNHSIYEKLCVFAGKLLHIDAGKRSKKISLALKTAHINCSASDALALAFIAPFIVWLLAVFLTVLIPFALTNNLSIYFILFSTALAFLVYVPLANMPFYLSSVHRQKVSNQMVIAIFYMVTYMRHTPNFELAIKFAANHVGPPLSLDLMKVLWDVETHRFKSVNDSLDNYLSSWHDDAREFIESIHMIEASLFEQSNDRRLNSLDKALDIMLEETYEKMLHYAQNLKSPLTMLHMLGIILPVLGLVILPLAVSFLGTHWTIIFSMYNIILPFLVFYLGKRILVSRPTGYGHSELGQIDTLLPKSAGFSVRAKAFIIFLILFFIGLSPIFLHIFGFPDFSFPNPDGPYHLLQYETDDNGRAIGPFGLGAGLLSLFITLAFGFSLAYYYRSRTKSLMNMRMRTRRLENEFASALFQLGNRIGEGLPAEIAFGKVARTMEGSFAGKFFSQVALNIQKLGMGVEEAIFNPSHGALLSYPSDLIESSMKVLVESSKKGSQEASRALISMSNYIREMHRVDERLRDLLTDVLSSMKSQIKFLLPTIAGIVIGITSMITTVLIEVQNKSREFNDIGAGSSLSDIFKLGIPTFYFQFIIGLYVVQVTWILAYLISGIENGVDSLSEESLKAKSLLMATTLYSIISFVVILAFNILAGNIIQGF